MRALITTWIASAFLIAVAVLPAGAATIDVNASIGGTTFTCCGNGTFTISGYLTPLYTFDGGTVDFGTVELSPFAEDVGASLFQVFMGSLSTSNGPLSAFFPNLLPGDVCIDGYGYSCNNLFYPTPITQSLSFTFPDNQATEFQMAFIGNYQYDAPAVTPLPPAWTLMLTTLGVFAALAYWRSRRAAVLV